MEGDRLQLAHESHAWGFGNICVSASRVARVLGFWYRYSLAETQEACLS